MNLLTVLVLVFSYIGATFSLCDDDLVQELSYKVGPAGLTFPCESTKNIYHSTGRFIRKNLISTRMQIWKDIVFVVFPRYKQGVPITVGTFSLKSKDAQPSITPYPCWSMQEEGNSNALQSAVDLVLDQDENLWILDIGVVNTLEQPVKRCEPRVVGINVKNGQVVKEINLSQFVTPSSRLQYLQIDYDAQGNVVAYISDAGVGAVIVYNISQSKGYRVILPSAITAGLQVKDILYIALVRNGQESLLYFSYLSSPRLYYIRSAHLQRGQSSGAVVDVGPKSQGKNIVILGTDNGSAIFFRYKGESDIYIWNTVSCFKKDNFLLVQKGDVSRLATQVVPGYKRLMWVIESNFQDYVTDTAGTLGPSVVVHPLVKTCDKK